MNFIFVCPREGKTFETDAFSLMDNRGIFTTSNGCRVLKATVVLDKPCPFCGERHQYRAEDLSCPFTRQY